MAIDVKTRPGVKPADVQKPAGYLPPKLFSEPVNPDSAGADWNSNGRRTVAQAGKSGAAYTPAGGWRE